MGGWDIKGSPWNYAVITWNKWSTFQQRIEQLMTKLQLVNHGFFLKENRIYPDDMNSPLFEIWMRQHVTLKLTAVWHRLKSHPAIKRSNRDAGKDVNEKPWCITFLHWCRVHLLCLQWFFFWSGGEVVGAIWQNAAFFFPMLSGARQFYSHF